MVHTWITKHLVRSEQAAATQIWDWVGISEGSGQDPFSVTSLLVMILVSWSDYHGISKCKAVCCKTHLLSDFCTKIPEMFMVGTNYKAHHISQKKQHISIYARNLFIAYTQPHQPKCTKNMYSKWWDNPTTLNAGLDCLLSTSISPFFFLNTSKERRPAVQIN